MSSIHFLLPEGAGEAMSFPFETCLPPPTGRKLANATIIVTSEARPERLWKFSPWEKAELAFHDIHIYSKLRQLDDHSGIVRLLGIGGTEEHFVRVVERSHQGELQRFLRDPRGNPRNIETKTVYAILQQIAHTMAGLHGINLVHRDLKAENILVFGSGYSDGSAAAEVTEVKVADFDRTIELAPGEKLSAPVGSLYHMAPELLAQEQYDRRVDIYAFGILMHEVAHGGARPYPNVATGMPGSTTASEFAAAVVNGGLRPAWQAGNAMLQELARRCVSPDPDDRPEFTEIVDILAPQSTARKQFRNTYICRMPETHIPETVGLAGNIGLQRNNMEDAACVVDLGTSLLVGVFDGLRGARSSTFAAHMLLATIASELQQVQKDGETDPATAILKAFEAIQAKLRRLDPAISCGTTATIALVSDKMVNLAWLGDSPAWLFQDAAAQPARLLINPHHPDREDEQMRIVAHGGSVGREEKMLESGETVPWGPLRVFAADGAGGIALTRALGLPALAPVITSEPELNCSDKTLQGQFLCLATDGVFEVLRSDDVQNIRAGATSAQQAAADTIEKTLLAGAPDNAAIIIIDLPRQIENLRLSSKLEGRGGSGHTRC